MEKKICFIFLIFSVFRMQLFFGFNYFYEGYNISDESTGGMLYKIIMTIFFLLLISIFSIKTLFFSRMKRFIKYLGIGLAFNLLLHLFFMVVESNLIFLSKDLLYFLILCLPGLFIIDFFYSINIDWKTKLSIIQNILILLLLIGDIFYFDFLKNLSTSRYLYTFGNLDYQGTAYFFALISGFFFIRLTKEFKLVRLIFLFNSLFLSIFAGGKGAFVLIILYVILNYYKILINIKYICVFLFLTLFFSQLNSNFIENFMGLQRILVLFDSEVGFSEISSGRDEVYSNIINKISDNIIFGIGPFSNYQLGYQPHNLAFDFFLRYGLIVGGVGLVCFISYVFSLLIKYPKLDFLTKWFLPYILILSFFSGSLFINEYLFFGVFSIFYSS
jgi:hypothetical protein